MVDSYSMSVLHPSHFFKLESFAHRVLFEGAAVVWEVLDRLPNYLNKMASAKSEGDISPQAYVLNSESVVVGPGTVVEAGAYIQGPCIIGANSRVRHGAYIRGGVLAGDRVMIGHDTEIKNSILLNDARAAHFAYIGDSILGNHVNLGAGTSLANLRLDGEEVMVRLAGERIATGRRKLGAIIGDGAQLGCNCVANPGTLIGPRAATYPCTNVGGIILPKTIIKT